MTGPDRSRLLELHTHPDLEESVLVVAMDGWIDAGGAAGAAGGVVANLSHAQKVGSFDTDELLDFRARRPTMRLVNGLTTELSWPEIPLSCGVDPGGRDLLLLSGTEPDRLWHRFTEEVVETAQALDVDLVVGFGAYPAAVPHTRPTRLALTTGSEDLSASMTGYVRGTLDVPAPIFAALEEAFRAEGIPAFCLWAQVPHYASNLHFPAGALALIEGLNRVAGTTFSPDQLRSEAEASRRHLNELIAANPDHQVLVTQLERAWDEATDDDAPSPTGFERLPSADELAEELQEFLRRSEGDS